MPRILVLNGPNLNLLGTREPEHYGDQSLDMIQARLLTSAKERGVDLDFFQTNHEGEMLDRIHAAMGYVDCIIINAGAWTHYSVALYDALKAVKIPFIEVHLSNIYARESFRRHSLLSPIAAGGIFGFGADVYDLAFEAACRLIARQP